MIVDAPHPGGADDQRFRKRDRLLKREEFLRVQQGGRKFSTPRLSVLSLASEEGRTRVGLTVSKKVGNAPMRARVRRLLREAFRLHKPWWPVGVDIVIIARAAASSSSLDELTEDLRRWSAWIGRERP